MSIYQELGMCFTCSTDLAPDVHSTVHPEQTHTTLQQSVINVQITEEISATDNQPGFI